MSPEDAAQLGWVWLGLRVLYAIIWLIIGKFTPVVLLSAMPMYSIISYLSMSTAFKYSLNIDITLDSAWLGVFEFTIAFYILFMTLGFFTEFIIQPFFFLDRSKNSQ